jgi:hypothetical protein
LSLSLSRSLFSRENFSDEPHFPGKFLTIQFSLLSLYLFLKMAAITSLSFSALNQYSDRKPIVPSARTFVSNSESFRFRTSFSCHYVGVRASGSTSSMVINCMSVSSGDFLYSAWLPRKSSEK